MQIFKTFVTLADGLYRIDTIEHEGRFWLAPEWIDTPRTGWSKPRRLVPLDLLGAQELQGNPQARFLVSTPIPKVLLSGPIPPQIAAQYAVIDLPDLVFETHSAGAVH